jgi:hypothetical protein
MRIVLTFTYALVLLHPNPITIADLMVSYLLVYFAVYINIISALLHENN